MTIFFKNSKNFGKTKAEKGQALIEIIMAVALSAVLLPALLTGFVASKEGVAQESQRLLATFLLREEMETVRSIREKGWNAFAVNGTYHPVISGSSWALAAGSETINGFTRQFAISDANRDSSGNITTSGGTLDKSTKKVVYTISWTTPNPSSTTFTEYFGRYIGNTVLTQTTQSDFDSGVKSNTRSTSSGGGTIELSPASSSGTFIDDYTTSSDYTFDSSKVEVAGGYGQLKNQGVPASGSTLNSAFTTGSTSWTFSRYDQNIGQSGNSLLSGGNPGGYVDLNFPASKSKTSGAYWRQPIVITTANSTATLSFQYKIFSYQATPNSFHIYAYIDTGSADPVTQVWDSGNITGTTAWSGTVNLNVSSYVATAGTYYLKMAAYVDFPGSTIGPYNVGFDNVLLTWNGITQVYASDSPTIYPNSSLSPSTLTSWNSFSETSTLNGGSIRYQISDDNGTNWYWFKNTGQGWVLETAKNPTDYNDATTINQQINLFPITNKKLKFKAFLIGNGTQQVKLDKITIGFTGTIGDNTGTFTSSTMDAGALSSFNRLIWTESNTSNTTTKLQIAINSDNSTWSYVGPDGTSSTSFTNGSGTIPLSFIEGRYFRYKITFKSTNTDIPTVSDVSVNYSP